MIYENNVKNIKNKINQFLFINFRIDKKFATKKINKLLTIINLNKINKSY